MNLRRFTQAGIAAFSDYLDKLKREPDRLPPIDILDDNVHSDVVMPTRGMSTVMPQTRREIAEILSALLPTTAPLETAADIGLWSWLSLYYFNVLCPLDRAGQRSPRELAAYIPEPGNFRRYYRHLLLGPYLIFEAHRDDPNRAQVLLCKPPHIIDDIVAQLASRYEYVTNPGIVGLATELYFDPTTGTTKRGAGGKGAGSPRRLADVLKQLDLTWDLFGMSIGDLRVILPGEFGRFLPAS